MFEEDDDDGFWGGEREEESTVIETPVRRRRRSEEESDTDTLEEHPAGTGFSRSGVFYLGTETDISLSIQPVCLCRCVISLYYVCVFSTV